MAQVYLPHTGVLLRDIEAVERERELHEEEEDDWVYESELENLEDSDLDELDRRFRSEIEEGESVDDEARHMVNGRRRRVFGAPLDYHEMEDLFDDDEVTADRVKWCEEHFNKA